MTEALLENRVAEKAELGRATPTLSEIVDRGLWTVSAELHKPGAPRLVINSDVYCASGKDTKRYEKEVEAMRLATLSMLEGNLDALGVFAKKLDGEHRLDLLRPGSMHPLTSEASRRELTFVLRAKTVNDDGKTFFPVHERFVHVLGDDELIDELQTGLRAALESWIHDSL